MNTDTIKADIGAVQGVAGEILKTIEAVDPALSATAELTENLLTLLAGLVNSALTAWSNASGTPITAETVAALLPNQTPLPPPTV